MVDDDKTAPVEESSPMKRGLKDVQPEHRANRAGGVEESSPMKRGLKATLSPDQGHIFAWLKSLPR